MAGGWGRARELLTGPEGRSLVGQAASTARMIWHHPENRGVRGRRLVGWLSWQLWERIVARPRVVHFHNGLRLICHPHDRVTSLAMYCGLYDSREMRFLLAYLRPGDTFLDVGANVAPYSLLATLVDGVSAVAFEPHPVARTRAAANVSLNGAEARVRLVPGAVSDAGGTALLTADRGPTNTLVDDGYDGEAQEVETVSLDSFVRHECLERVSLVKVDVEGHEPEVLRGAKALIADQRPALIVACNDGRALQRFAAEHGYTAVTYTPGTAALDRMPWPPARRGANVILVPDLLSARTRVGSSQQLALADVGEE